MEKHVINFFQRNPEAGAAHVVLDFVYATAVAASRARKSFGARKVTMILREEYEQWLEQSKDVNAESNNNIKEN